jgi:hypothetical protein
MGKTVYFFGAGATKAVVPKAPLNKDLVKNALTHFRDSSEAVRIRSFLALLFKQRDDVPIDNQVWNLLDYIIQQGKSACREFNLEEIIEIRRCLLSLVIREFQESLETASSGVFQKLISKMAADSAIISTNYDILIDQAFAKAGGLNYGAIVRSAVAGEHRGEAGIKRAYSYLLPNLNIDSIPLLKIHGSLNWLFCPKCDEVDVTADKGVVRTLSGDYHCMNPSCTCRYESLLITPTMFKNYENRFIKDVWKCAENELTAAENLIFVGYSLKEEDYQIRCLLMKAMLNKSDPYKNVTVIEQNAASADFIYLNSVEQNFTKLYRDVDFRPIGFEPYVAETAGLVIPGTRTK